MPCECLLLKDYVMDRRIASTLVFLPSCPCGHLIVLWSPSCPCGHLVVLVVTQLSLWSPGCPCGRELTQACPCAVLLSPEMQSYFTMHYFRPGFVQSL